jgi:hypothetical protein
MRLILHGSFDCVTKTGEHQIDTDKSISLDKTEISCIICGKILASNRPEESRKGWLAEDMASYGHGKE